MGQTGAVYYLVAGRWFSAPDFTGPWTFATPNAARGLQEDPARAPALARARVGARHAAGGRGGAARAGSADGARQQEGAEGARGRVPGRAEVRADREDHGRSARSTPTRTSSRSATSTTCASRACGSCRKTPDRPVGGHRRRCRRRSTRSRSSSPVAQRHLRDGREDDDDEWVDVRDGAGVHGRDGRLGLRRVGHRLLLPAVLRATAGLPVLLPALSDLRLRRLVQPVDRRLRRGGAVAYGPYGGAGVGARYNPRDRHLLARRRGVRARTARAAAAPGLQPAHRRLRRRRGRARTSTAAGAAPRCSAATSGRHRRASPTTGTGNTTRVTQGSGGGAAVTRSGGPGGDSGVVRTGSGDVYAGHDGNVYRKQDGGWQKYDNGNWGSVDKPQREAGTGTTAARDRAGQAGPRHRRLHGAGARPRGVGRSAGPVDDGQPQPGLEGPLRGHPAHPRLQQLQRAAAAAGAPTVERRGRRRARRRGRAAAVTPP